MLVPVGVKRVALALEQTRRARESREGVGHTAERERERKREFGRHAELSSRSHENTELRSRHSSKSSSTDLLLRTTI